MAEESDQTLFLDTLRRNSESKEYPDFLLEWKEFNRIDSGQYGLNKCICNHPIREEVHIRNKFTNVKLIVGNVCIKKFAKEIVTEKCIYCGEMVRKAKNQSQTFCKDCKKCKKMKGGKYSGKTLFWVMKNDPSYFEWMERAGRKALSGWAFSSLVFDWFARRNKNRWIDSDVSPIDEPQESEQKLWSYFDKPKISL